MFFTFVENNVVSYIVPNVSNKVHKFPFCFIYDMGELMGFGGGRVRLFKEL